ncbi:conserved exported hypothetical protein [Vibrio chagasii]|nr:conserved exported hypothetical protein [Vibrio chagasii]
MKRVFLSALAIFATSVGACVYHGEGYVYNAEPPAGSLATVVKSKSYERSGVLKPVPELSGDAAFRRVGWWLQLLANKFPEVGVKQTFVYLSDIELWAYYDIDERTSIFIEDEPVDDGGWEYPYMTMTEVTLYSIISGEVSVSAAAKAMV